MAYIRKTKSGYRVQVERGDVRRSATWPTKAQATAWAAQQEAELLALKHGEFPRKTLADAMARYVDEVSARKRGERYERLRLEAMKREFPALVAMQITDVDTPHLAAWRDKRLRSVSPGSVQREANLLRNVFSVARDEWRWCDHAPFKGMRMPGENAARDRRVTPQEAKRLVRWLGYRTGMRPQSKQQEVALAILLALRTAMRAGELLSLSDSNVDLSRRVAKVAHKMQHLTGRPREVPLSRAAVRLLTPVMGSGPVFTVSSESLDTMFRKARDSLQIKGLRFHDTRGEALTRFARKVDVMTLAKISGHKDLRILMEHYYRESATDIAHRL